MEEELKTIKVELNVGKFKLREPLAGDRNKALITAEGDNGKIRQFVFLTELLPSCIIEHPWGAIKHPKIQIDKLRAREYDKLTTALGSLMKEGKEDLDNTIKKSDGLSSTEEDQTPEAE